jgi:hypothetical protein
MDKGKKQIVDAVEQGSKPSSQSAYVFLAFVISSLFSNLLRELLPYMMCLLYGCRLNAALQNGDPLIRLNAERCFEEHRLLERLGRAYSHNLKGLLRCALDIGIIRKRVIDLSIDPTHLVYWGVKMIKRWGTPFSTMKNRALPGLLPITCFDLLSGLILFMSDFIGKAKRDRRGKAKDAGKVVAKKVLRSVDFLRKEVGIRVRSLTGDEGMCSEHLLRELEKRDIRHLFALSSRSSLGKLVPTIDGWTRLEDGRLIGMKRGVEYHGLKTNLIALKDDDRTYLYISNYGKGARYVWSRYCRRGKHENSIGVAKSIGLEDGRPSTNLFQVKGHALACIYLMILLKALSKRLGLDPNKEPQTIKSLLTRQCYVRWDEGRLMALVVVSRTLLARIGTSKIEWDGGSIELVWHQGRNATNTLMKIGAKG